MGLCSCCMGIVGKIIVALITLAKVGCAVAIIVITAVHLYKVDYNTPSTNSTTASILSDSFTVDCQLGTSWEDVNLCDYAFVVCAVSLAVSLAVSILLCCTCDLCGLGFIIEVVLSACGTLWWLAASLVFSAHVKEANDAGGINSEVTNWRNAVVVLSWAAFVLFALTFLIYLGKMLAKLCTCCGCCDGDDDNKHK